MRGEIAVPCKTAKLLTGPAEFNSPWQQAYEVAVLSGLGPARPRVHEFDLINACRISLQ
jgi:hypothetical protein